MTSPTISIFSALILLTTPVYGQKNERLALSEIRMSILNNRFDSDHTESLNAQQNIIDGIPISTIMIRLLIESSEAQEYDKALNTCLKQTYRRVKAVPQLKPTDNTLIQNVASYGTALLLHHGRTKSEASLLYGKSCVDRIIAIQNRDGGWGSSSICPPVSNIHTTALVLELIEHSRFAGPFFERSMIDSTKRFVTQMQPKTKTDKRANAFCTELLHIYWDKDIKLRRKTRFDAKRITDFSLLTYFDASTDNPKNVIKNEQLIELVNDKRFSNEKEKDVFTWMLILARYKSIQRNKIRNMKEEFPLD